MIGFLAACNEETKITTQTDHTLTAEGFRAFIEKPGTLNIVDYSATWCGPCQQLKPVLAQIAEEHSDIVSLGMVDVDDDKSLASQQGVQGIPDVRFYINGKMVDKFTGAAPKEYIEQLIEKHSKHITSADSGTAASGSTNTDDPENENPLPPGMSRQ